MQAMNIQLVSSFAGDMFIAFAFLAVGFTVYELFSKRVGGVFRPYFFGFIFLCICFAALHALFVFDAFGHGLAIIIDPLKLFSGLLFLCLAFGFISLLPVE